MLASQGQLANFNFPVQSILLTTLYFLIDHFSSAELKQIEGTILLYVGNAMKQNQYLGKSFLKMLKVLD